MLINTLYAVISVIRMHNIYRGKNFHENVLLSEMVRNVHSIEKGMCIEKPRLEYGKAKIKLLFNLIEEYYIRGYTQGTEEILMATDSIKAYIIFHKNNGVESDYLKEIERRYEDTIKIYGINKHDTAYAGYLEIEKHSYSREDVEVLKKVMTGRHSIRDFDESEVLDKKIREAVSLANNCPSACNRQTTRVYVLKKEHIAELQDWLSGIGGFADTLNNMIVITGKISAFNDGEVFQHIMNAGIFTGYLVMSLESLGIGACVIQRPLLYSRRWNMFAKRHGIPIDEQITCVLAIGNLKDKYRAPVSHRFNTDKIVSYIK